MLICTIPPVLGIFTMCLMPKSPKFLLFKGKSNEALRVFKAMYSMNNLESPDRFKVILMNAHTRKTFFFYLNFYDFFISSLLS